jgi:hypothetical protein
MQLADARVSERPLFSERDRWFESAFLQRGVRNEPSPEVMLVSRFSAICPFCWAECEFLCVTRNEQNRKPDQKEI